MISRATELCQTPCRDRGEAANTPARPLVQARSSPWFYILWRSLKKSARFVDSPENAVQGSL